MNSFEYHQNIRRRTESEKSIAERRKVRGSTLALKPKTDDNTTRPKRGMSGPTKGTDVQQN